MCSGQRTRPAVLARCRRVRSSELWRIRRPKERGRRRGLSAGDRTGSCAPAAWPPGRSGRRIGAGASVPSPRNPGSPPVQTAGGRARRTPGSRPPWTRAPRREPGPATPGRQAISKSPGARRIVSRPTQPRSRSVSRRGWDSSGPGPDPPLIASTSRPRRRSRDRGSAGGESGASGNSSGRTTRRRGRSGNHPHPPAP